MLKPLLLLPAVLVMAYAGSPAPQKTTNPAGAIEKVPAASAKVKDLYKFDCAMCHGEAGDGKTDLGQSMGVISNFSDPKTFEGKSDQQIFDAIRKGKDKMPPEDAGRANDDQVKGLVQFLRTLSKDKPAVQPAEQPAPAAQAPATSPTGN